MYRLSDYLQDVWKVSPLPQCDLICAEADAESMLVSNRMHDTLACYAFMIVNSGWLKIVSNGREQTLQRNDLYIYTPGFSISIVEGSDDFRCICLVADESLTFETPIIRNMIRAAYFPVVELHEPIVTLSEAQAEHIRQSMRVMIDYLKSNHLFKENCLQMLYSVFLLDLMNIREQQKIHKDDHLERAEELFVDFIRLIPQHFIEHHNISFYADQLNITPIYLSRVVKKITGRTVVDYINQMLLMEASWLLLRTDKSIAQIATQLHFADQASFSKFFARLKGITPKAYRKQVGVSK